jgi:hypothetical protein
MTVKEIKEVLKNFADDEEITFVVRGRGFWDEQKTDEVVGIAKADAETYYDEYTAKQVRGCYRFDDED